MCRTACGTCLKEGIDGYQAPQCCTNGIDDTLQCPMTIKNESVAVDGNLCNAYDADENDLLCHSLLTEMDCCGDEHKMVCTWNHTQCGDDDHANSDDESD